MKLYSYWLLVLGLVWAPLLAQAEISRNQKLFHSLAQGDSLSVRIHLAKGAQPVGTDSKGRNALHLAASFKDAQLLSKLINNKAYKLPINAVDHMGQSPLFEAVEAGHLPSVQLLLTHGGRVDLRTRAFGDTLLHRAAALGHTEMIKLFVAKGLNPNTQDLDGHTPLHKAAQHSIPSIDTLLNLGAEIEARSIIGQTPFLLAARLGKVETAKHLAKKGALLTATDEKKRNALQLAIENIQPHMVSVLNSTGVYKKTLEQDLSLSQARIKALEMVLQKSPPTAQKGLQNWLLSQARYTHKILQQKQLPNASYQEVLTFLTPPLDQGVKNAQLMHTLVDVTPSLSKINTLMKPEFNLEAKNSSGHTPLLWACLEGKLNSAQLLIQAGANLKATNKNTGHNFLHLAAAHQLDRDKLIWFINKAVDKDLNLGATDQQGWTPLHYAAAHGHEQSVMLLLQHKTHSKPETGKPEANSLSSMALAALNGHLKVVKYFYWAQKNRLTTNKSTLQQPLVLAARQGHYKVVDYLLKQKVSAKAVDQALRQANQSMAQAKKQLPHNINQYNGYKLVVEALKNKQKPKITHHKKVKR